MVELALFAPDLCDLLDMTSELGVEAGRIEPLLATISGCSPDLMQRIGGLDPEEKAALEMFLRASAEASTLSDRMRRAG